MVSRQSFLRHLQNRLILLLPKKTIVRVSGAQSEPFDVRSTVLIAVILACCSKRTAIFETIVYVIDFSEKPRFIRLPDSCLD